MGVKDLADIEWNPDVYVGQGCQASADDLEK